MHDCKEFQNQRPNRLFCLHTLFTSACVSIAVVPSSTGAASADAGSSVCMGSSVELAAVLTPSVMDEID